MYSHIFGHLSSFLLLPAGFSKLQTCKAEQRHGNEADVYVCHVQCYIQQYIYISSHSLVLLQVLKHSHHLLCQGSEKLSWYFDSLRYMPPLFIFVVQYWKQGRQAI